MRSWIFYEKTRRLRRIPARSDQPNEFAILTEEGEELITEDGDDIVLEEAPSGS